MLRYGMETWREFTEMIMVLLLPVLLGGSFMLGTDAVVGVITAYMALFALSIYLD